MKTIVIGLEGAESDRLLCDPGLVNVRALMMEGASGRLSDLPALDAVSPWITLASGRETGPFDEVGDSGRSNTDPSMRLRAPSGPMLWDLLGNEDIDGAAILIDVPRHDRSGPASGIVDRSKTWPPPEIEIWPTELAAEIRPRIEVPGRGDGASSPVSRTRARFLALRHLMEARPWSYAQLIDDAPARLLGSSEDEVADHWYATLDEELGRTLQGLTGEVSVLLVSVKGPGPIDPGDGARPKTTGSFVLATSRGLPLGEFDGARLIDLAPTLLSIAGRAIPEEIVGRPLGRHQKVAPPLDDDAAALERLRGLGYLA